MNFLTLILSGLLFHRRAHVAVLVGALISSAILVGALIVGDSVRHSLQHLAEVRLGRTEYALSAGDRFFRAELADDLALEIERDVAPIIRLRGIAIKGGGSRRANGITALGVDNRFWSIGGVASKFSDMGDDEAIVNQRLATRLDLQTGDEILLKAEKIDRIPHDAPLSSDKKDAVSLRLTIKGIAGDDQFGRFSLQADQVPPLNIFLPLHRLSKKAARPSQANMLLIAENTAHELPMDRLSQALKDCIQLADAGLSLRFLQDRKMLELRSDQVFIGQPIADAIASIPGNHTRIFSYFVNEIRSAKKTVPYSFITAISASDSALSPDRRPIGDEIIINEWLARDLFGDETGVGERIELSYFTLRSKRKLSEQTSFFRVKSIVPVDKKDSDLMPEFPGLSHTEHCRDWDPGIPIDLDKIREKDEVYWEKYRGAPKAFISYEAARRMWGNRYGEVTAIRFIGWSDYLDSDNHLSQDAQKILRRLEPHALGLTFQPVREQGLQAGEESVDFAQLFIGLSFFIIIAALTLTGLLFAFGIERRRTETGVLLALGYEPRLVRKLLLAEGAILSIVGGLLGVCAGLLYHQAILLALKHLWYDVVGVSTLRLHVDPQTLIIGGLLGAVSALATIWFVSGGQFHHSPVDLLRGKSRIKSISKTKNRFNQALALLSLIGATLILLIGERGVFSLDRGIASPGKFFAAGFLSLIGFIAISGIVLSRLELWGVSRNLTVTTAGIRNCVRNRRRSLAVIGSLACGIFLVVSVGANRGDPARFPEKRSSGTGGFALWAETTIPILHDLNEKETKERLGLHGFSDSVRFTPLRVREGDDASCLNLNRTQRPQILGVRPEEFDNLGAFSFAQTTVGHDDHPWLSLKEDWGDDVIPGIADQTVITYGLGKSVGDTLHYLDEQGRSLNVKLVGGLENSIFQGNIIIDEEQFIRKFPSLSGSRIFLVDAPYENQKNLLLDLSDSLQDFGADLTQTSTRLVEFSAVQNGYLSIFLSLGGLGLLLGTIGLGVVVWRHTMERRSEFAILRSLGFSHSALYRLILTEHTPLLLLGTVGGTLSAAIAVLPAMTSSGGQIPYLFIASILISILLSGFFWIQVAAWTALRGDLIPALRDE